MAEGHGKGFDGRRPANRGGVPSLSRNNEGHSTPAPSSRVGCITGLEEYLKRNPLRRSEAREGE